MGNENIADALRVDSEPAHLFLKAVIVIAGVNHHGRIALAVKENIRNPLPDTGDIVINPARVQRLENIFSAVHLAHALSLELGCFLRQNNSPFLILVSVL